MASSSGPLRSTHADPAEQANAENRKPTCRWLELADVAPCSVGSVWCTVWWCWLGMRRGRGPGRGQGQGGAGRGRGHGTRCAGWIAIGCVAFYGSFCSRFQSQLTLCPRPPHLTLRSPYAIAFVVSRAGEFAQPSGHGPRRPPPATRRPAIDESPRPPHSVGVASRLTRQCPCPSGEWWRLPPAAAHRWRPPRLVRASPSQPRRDERVDSRRTRIVFARARFSPRPAA